MEEDPLAVSFGGRLSHFFNNWKKLTSDTQILKYIEGVTFELNNVPNQTFVCPEYSFDQPTKELMSAEIDLFLDKNIIEKVGHEDGEIVSNIFPRKKKSGKIRIIGNFKDINSK